MLPSLGVCGNIVEVLSGLSGKAQKVLRVFFVSEFGCVSEMVSQMVDL